MKLAYAKDKYVADGSLAIQSWIEEDGILEPYGDVTVCLKMYGLTPEEGYIYMPTYKMTYEYRSQIIEDIVDAVIGEVQIGYGTGLYVRLKDNWEDAVEMHEWW